MGRHTFQFEGGEELTTMGAGWFVSYSYYMNIDSNHMNWNKVSTYKNRISVYKRTRNYHKTFLNEILNMADGNLNKNTIALDAAQIKDMAKKVLNK